ncbi:MAG: EAL domain-containing protein [Sphingomonas sp.]|nr:EAL domain-containing protein [Sphingomonas sp.]
MSRNNLHPHSASGEIVLVSIDDRALREVGRWPWPRRRHAELVDKLTEAGAERIFFDILFETHSTAEDDNLFASAIKRSGRVVLPVRGATGANGLAKSSGQPIPILRDHAELGSITVRYNYQNAVWELPYSVPVDGKPVPSFAAKLGRHEKSTGTFTPDYSLQIASIPTVGAETVLNGQFDPRAVRGKDIIIGTNSEVIGDQYFVPGLGRTGGVFVQIAGAETLRAGKVISVGWVPAFLLALVLTVYATIRRVGRNRGLFAAATVVLVAGPVPLEANLIFVDTTPALFVILTVWTTLWWRNVRRTGLVNPISGLPNLDALRANRAGRSQAIIATRVLNYEEALATLPRDSERQLVQQIVSRLRVGDPDRVLYQGDGGIFAWFEEARLPFGNHIDALHGMFRNPARIAGQSIDLSVAFGVEIGSNRSLSSRLASALVAAEEAAHAGLKRKYHDPETLQNAAWKLSMLSQLDSAIDKGEVWIAYQPKLELSTRQIVGAEALARWTHPEKGPIAASEFVAAAEQHDRIGKLTDFVLDRAIAAAAAITRHHPGFGVAVNLSARLLSDQGFALRLTAMLARNRLQPQQLTLELTETAELASSGAAFDVLATLREMGVAISIDDYGTGLSTLEYLKKVPAGEIKIDQSFVKGMLDNRSDRLMVQSTIGLAHSLGRRVVAEGVEQRDTLEALAEMQCDFAQGFIVGRPMSLESLMRRLPAANEHRVA